MIDGENFFDQPAKNDLRAYDNFGKIAIVQGDNYKTGHLLGYHYLKKVISYLQ